MFRENSGACILFATTLMRVAPRLKVHFDRDDLRAQVVPFGTTDEPTHKVRFWILDKGGKNKRNDLRRHIVSAELDAEL